MRFAVIAVLFMITPGLALAQGYGGYAGKAGSWEWSIAGLYQEAENADAGGGSLIEVDEGFGLGFGIGRYLTDRLVVGADFEWLAPDYSATLVDDNGDTTQFSHELTQLNFRFKGAYYFLDGPFSRTRNWALDGLMSIPMLPTDRRSLAAGGTRGSATSATATTTRSTRRAFPTAVLWGFAIDSRAAPFCALATTITNWMAAATRRTRL